MEESFYYRPKWTRSLGLIDVPETKKRVFIKIFKSGIQNKILNKIEIKNLIKQAKTIEDIFWPVLLLSETDSISSQLASRITRFILSFRFGGGFYSTRREQPDIKTTFYAVLALQVLGAPLEQDEREVTIHFIRNFLLREKIKTSMETYYSLSILVLLDSLHVVNEEEYFKVLKKKIPEPDRTWTYLILKHFNLERKFCERHPLKIEMLKGDEEFFWGILALMSSNYLSERKIAEIFNRDFLEYFNSEMESDKKEISFAELKQFCMKTLLGLLLFIELEDQIELSLYQGFSKHNSIVVKELTEQYNLSKDMILEIVEYLADRYPWFNVKKVTYDDLAAINLKNLEKRDQKSAQSILKQARTSSIIELKTLRKKLKVREEDVLRLLTYLLEVKLLLGSIQQVEREKETINVLMLEESPNLYLISKKKVPFELLVEEKIKVQSLNHRLQERMIEFQAFPEDFREGIEYSLDNNELELAKSKLVKNFQNYSILVDHAILDVKVKVKYFKFFGYKDIDSYTNFLEISKKIKNHLDVTLKELYAELKKQERLNTSYQRLIEFVDQVNAAIARMQQDLDFFGAIFFRTCSRHELTPEKNEEYVQKSREMEESFKNIAKDISNKNKQFAHLTKKFKELRDLLIYDSRTNVKKVVMPPLLVKEKPFEAWFRDQWDFKRGQFIKIITDMQGSIYKRDQLIDHVQKKQGEIDALLKKSRDLSDPEDIYKEVVNIMEIIADTNQYINDFTYDTAKILEIFPEVGQDIPYNWSLYKKSIQKELKKNKAVIEKKLLAEELNTLKNQLEAWITDALQSLELNMNKWEELEKVEWKTFSKTFQESFEEIDKKIRQEMKELDDQIEKGIRRIRKKFTSFTTSTMIPYQNWKHFLRSYENERSQKRNQLLERIILGLTLHLFDLKDRGGRISYVTLEKYLGVTKKEIKQILDVLQAKTKITIITLDSDNFSILNNEMERQMMFEEFMASAEHKIVRSNNRFFNSFNRTLQRKKMKNNEESIEKQVANQIHFLTEITAQINSEFRQESKTIYNSALIAQFYDKIGSIQINLELIESMLNDRKSFRKRMKKQIDKYTANLEEIRQEEQHITGEQVEDYLKMFKDFLVSIEEMKIKLSIEGELLDKKYDDFRNWISDLIVDLNKIVKRLQQNTLLLEKQAITKFKIALEKSLFEKLSEKITSYRGDFKNFLRNLERDLIKHSDMEGREKLWSEKEREVMLFLDASAQELKSFINQAEKERGLTLFKHDVQSLLKEWNVEETKEALSIYHDAINKAN